MKIEIKRIYYNINNNSMYHKRCNLLSVASKMPYSKAPHEKGVFMIIKENHGKNANK